MALTLFGIPNCDTVKRARSHLDAAGISFEFHDFKKAGLDKETANAMIEHLGADAINRRGTKWRSLTDDEKALGDSDPASLMVTHPTLAKRPVWRLEADGEVHWKNGFKKGEEDQYDLWLKG